MPTTSLPQVPFSAAELVRTGLRMRMSHLPRWAVDVSLFSWGGFGDFASCVNRILIQSCYFVLSRAVLQLSISSEEKGEVDAFNSSLGSLIASGELVGVSYEDHRQFKPCDSLWLSVYSLFTVANKDAETSKEAFVTSAGALEKWVILTGLAGKITGL